MIHAFLSYSSGIGPSDLDLRRSCKEVQTKERLALLLFFFLLLHAGKAHRPPSKVAGASLSQAFSKVFCQDFSSSSMESRFSLFKRSKKSSESSSPKPLSKAAALRIQSEAHEWLMNPPSEFDYSPTDDLRRWVVKMHGAPGTLYANEAFTLQFDFTDDYPMEAPEVIFLPPAPLHPHVYSNGHICLDILYDKWSPALSVSSVCFSLLSMLSSCTKKERPLGNDMYVRKCIGGRSPKEANWWFHDDNI